jgi:uncharacterized membrane protein
MEAYLLDWANLLLRWSHVVVAIAWIGASFYFVFLDLSLTEPTDPLLKEKGVGGELWAVHGGGFYHPQKYTLAPQRIPEHLHWFYWESYATWLTGFGLFTALYLFNADTFLIDRRLHDWSAPAAIATAIGLLVAFWIVYDLICRCFGEKANGDRVVGVLIALYLVFAAWLACRLFAGRAAFLLTGAMMATAMSANVLFWIIPGQRTVIAQMRAHQPVDPVHGLRGKQRSVHNTYFTLPVVIAMLSNHYGFLYGAPHNWIVLLLVMGAGASIRQFFVARHVALRLGKPLPWGYAIGGCLVIAGVIGGLAPRGGTAASERPVSFAEVQQVIGQRCAMCHNAETNNKGIQLHTPELVAKNAQALYQQAVVLKLMPLNNATQITDDERAALGRWFKAGAPTK